MWDFKTFFCLSFIRSLTHSLLMNNIANDVYSHRTLCQRKTFEQNQQFFNESFRLALATRLASLSTFMYGNIFSIDFLFTRQSVKLKSLPWISCCLPHNVNLMLIESYSSRNVFAFFSSYCSSCDSLTHNQ